MKNDDEINESSISDLIHYAEDEKRNTFDDEPETDDELDDEITETCLLYTSPSPRATR